MALLPLPEARLSLIVLVILAAPALGLLWAPAMAMLSDAPRRAASIRVSRSR